MDWGQLISQVAFPIFACTYFMVVMNKTLEKHTQVLKGVLEAVGRFEDRLEKIEVKL